LLFCVASDTDWEHAGITGTTVTTMIVRGLSALGEWPEYVCTENRHEYYSGRDTAVPTADKPDF
jgi:hypothetical protein